MAQEPEIKSASPEYFTLFDEKKWNVSNNVAISTSGHNGAVLGAKEINYGVYQWLVLFELGTEACCYQIGISTNVSKDILSKNVKILEYKNTVCLHFWNKRTATQAFFNFDGKQNKIADLKTSLQSGDKIGIILDYNQKMVTFYQNGELIFTKKDIPTGLDQKYRLIVDSDGTENKYTILESNNKLPTISLKPLTSVLNQMSKELNAFDVKTLQNLSITDLSVIKQDTVKFMNECKEYEQNFENFKKIVKQFDAAIDKEMNPDTKDFTRWTTDQICRYVLSLENQRYAKYMQEFRENIQKQQVKGADLVDINANDLLSMGINVFRDRKDLVKYFQLLGDNEGNVTENH